MRMALKGLTITATEKSIIKKNLKINSLLFKKYTILKKDNADAKKSGVALKLNIKIKGLKKISKIKICLSLILFNFNIFNKLKIAR